MTKRMVSVPEDDWRHVVGALKNAKARLPMGAAIGNVSDALSKVEHLQAAPAPSSLAGGEVPEAAKRLGSDIDEGRITDFAVSRDIAIVLAALSPEAPARDGVEADGTIYLMLHGMRSWALEMIRKHGDPNGTDYEQGQNDMGHRWVSSIDERLARLDALTPRHEAPAPRPELAPYTEDLKGIKASMLADEAPAEGAGEDELTLRGLATLINGYARDRDREGLPQTAETLRHAALIIDHYRELRARSSAPEAREEALGNLLAAIHGDGGHRALEVGVEQAAAEAEKIVAGLFAAPSAGKLRIAVEALEPFAAFARVAEAKSRLALGKVLPDNEVIASTSWEGGLGVLVMGHLRDALTLVPDAKGWGGIYRRSEDLAALKAEGC